MSKIDQLADFYGANILGELLRDKRAAPYFDSVAGGATLFAEAQADPAFIDRLKKHRQTAEDDKRVRALYGAFVAAATPAPKYAEWISKIFLGRLQNNSPIAARDLRGIREKLTDYEDLKKGGAHNQTRFGKTDINAYGTLNDLTNTLRPLLRKRDAARTKGDAFKKAAQAFADQTTVLYDGPAGKIVIPHSKEASQYWGQGTKLCVAATESSNDFHLYNPTAPVVMFLPAVTAADRASAPDLRVFKFVTNASETESRMRNELDQQLGELPAPLQRLCDEALAALPSGAADYLRQVATDPPDPPTRFQRFTPTAAPSAVIPAGMAPERQAGLQAIARSGMGIEILNWEGEFAATDFLWPAIALDALCALEAPKQQQAFLPFWRRAVAINPLAYAIMPDALMADKALVIDALERIRSRGLGTG